MKTLLSLFVSAFSLTFLLISAPASACGCMEPPVYDQVAGQHGPYDPGMYSATTDAEWQRLWTLIGEKPRGDFIEGAHTAVAVFMGMRSTGGYDVAVDGIYWDDTSVRVAFVELEPDGPVTQALTTPYKVVILNGTAETVFDEHDMEIVSPLSFGDCAEPMEEMEQTVSDVDLGELFHQDFALLENY